MNVIVVYNICGISGNERVDRYKESIRCLLAQNMWGTRVVVSSCRSSQRTLDELHREFGNRVSWYRTDETWPVNITFNHAARRAADKLGAAAVYVYSDSGVVCPDTHTLRGLIEEHWEYGDAMTACRTDTDMGFNMWFPGRSEDEIFGGGDRLPIMPGQAVNLHLQAFSYMIPAVFGRVLPDVFASHCTESIFPYICAALRMGFTVWRGRPAQHAIGLSMDGGSSGFPPNETPGWRHLLPQAQRGIDEILSDPLISLCGMGYEECAGILPHIPAFFDNHGMSRTPAPLTRFIADNFYLTSAAFDYDHIKHEFIV